MYSKSKLLEKALLHLGLNQEQIKVYESLLSVKELNIKALSAQFGTNRVRIYAILDKLQEFGLLKYDKKYSRTFQIESPSKILGLLRFQEVESNRITKDFSDYLPDLLTNFNSVSRNPTFKLYEGKSQFLAVFNQILDELKKGDEILAIGEGEDFNEVIYTSYFQEWMKRRIKKGLKTRILGRQNNSFLKAIKTFDKEQLRELKFLPPEFELTEGNLFILPTKIIIWNTVEIQCVVIENRAIASFFKGIFEGVWRQN